MKKSILAAGVFALFSCFLSGCAAVDSGKSAETPSRQSSRKPVKQQKTFKAPQSRPGVFCGDKEVSDDF